MPSIFELYGYRVFFWSNEYNEPIHVHVCKGKPSQDSTKIWLTKNGGCVVAHNKSQIPNDELNRIMEAISSNYFVIVSKWKAFNLENDIKFYC